jgi:hypothetical protein
MCKPRQDANANANGKKLLFEGKFQAKDDGVKEIVKHRRGSNQGCKSRSRIKVKKQGHPTKIRLLVD